MANYNTIILEQENGITRLTLNRPDRLNALNGEMILELGKALPGETEVPGVLTFYPLV